VQDIVAEPPDEAVNANQSKPEPTGATAGTGAPAINKQLTSEEIHSLRQQLEELTLEHRDLDDVIDHLIHSDYPDQLQLKRLKKRKLRLKDAIDQIQSRLIPDIDA
jgi:hypothetical protein